MLDEPDFLDEPALDAPFWPAFGDLMACLLGVFVLLFAWVVTDQVALSEHLQAERRTREATEAKLHALQSALSAPLASGLITLEGDRIGIRGAVLFASSRDRLREKGQALIKELAPPLTSYLEEHEVALMVSGFTDDRPLSGFGEFADNWELSTARALTVTRELVAAGVPPDRVIAAGFGEHHPIADNDTDEHRARNRRVEIVPVPKLEGMRAQLTRTGTLTDAAGKPQDG